MIKITFLKKMKPQEKFIKQSGITAIHGIFHISGWREVIFMDCIHIKHRLNFLFLKAVFL